MADPLAYRLYLAGNVSCMLDQPTIFLVQVNTIPAIFLTMTATNAWEADQQLGAFGTPVTSFKCSSGKRSGALSCEQLSVLRRIRSSADRR